MIEGFCQQLLKVLGMAIRMQNTAQLATKRRPSGARRLQGERLLLRNVIIEIEPNKVADSLKFIAEGLSGEDLEGS
jgi:hypothetical protein